MDQFSNQPKIKLSFLGFVRNSSFNVYGPFILKCFCFYKKPSNLLCCQILPKLIFYLPTDLNHSSLVLANRAAVFPYKMCSIWLINYSTIVLFDFPLAQHDICPVAYSSLFETRYFCIFVPLKIENPIKIFIRSSFVYCLCVYTNSDFLRMVTLD